jgi:hypothetical protein
MSLSINPTHTPAQLALPTNLPSPEERMDQLQQEAEMQMDHCPEAERVAYKRRVRREIAQMRQAIADMRAQGFGVNAINKAIEGLTQKVHESLNSFREGNAQFAESSERVCSRNQSTINKIGQCTVNFAPITRMPADDDSDDEKNPLASYFQDILPEVKSMGKRYVKGIIKQKFGSRNAEVVDKLEKFFSVQPPQECDSPVRFRVISVAVQYGVATTVAYCLPTGWAYGAMKTSDVVAMHADRLTPALKKMQTDEEVNAWWKHQRDVMGIGKDYLESIEAAQGFVELSKVPTVCLKAIHNTLVDACSEMADKIGLTDRNVALIACSSLEFIAQHSPEALEERVWEAAWIEK